MKRTLDDLRRAREEMFERLPVGKYETSIEAMGLGVLIADCTLSICERLDLISAQLDKPMIQITEAVASPECKIEVGRTVNAPSDEEEGGEQEGE